MRPTYSIFSLYSVLREHLFCCIFDKRIHQSASERNPIFRIFWDRPPDPLPLIYRGKQTPVHSQCIPQKSPVFSNFQPPPPLYKSWLWACKFQSCDIWYIAHKIMLQLILSYLHLRQCCDNTTTSMSCMHPS